MSATVENVIVGLTKQVFISEYLVNGLFPCNSNIVKLIRAKKRDWQFTDKFEYRMRFAIAEGGGSLPSQVFQPNLQLNKPGQLAYGIYRATYGEVTNGFDIDMNVNLETQSKMGAFELEYSERMNSLRISVASMFRNFALHGQYGVVHQLRKEIGMPDVSDAGFNPCSNVLSTDAMVATAFGIVQGTNATPAAIGTGNDKGWIINPDVVLKSASFKMPINVYNTGFKRGRILIKTCRAKVSETALYSTYKFKHAPWGRAFCAEMYQILDCQDQYITIIPVGTLVTPWKNGEYLELANNRECAVWNPTLFRPDNWNGTVTVAEGCPDEGMVFQQFTKGQTFEYASDSSANSIGVNGRGVGAMEGLADMFPWYTDPEDVGATINGKTYPSLRRLGIDLPYRDQPNRLTFAAEQCGGWVYQRIRNGQVEHIMDGIMRAIIQTKSRVPHGEILLYINSVTLQRIGYEETSNNFQVVRQNLIAAPIVYQRGVDSTIYKFGNSQIQEVIEDNNLDTDVIIVGPKLDLSYNCFDNSMFKLDQYIKETWPKGKAPPLEKISLPNELIASMDMKNRIMYGTPTTGDGAYASFSMGNNIRHSRDIMPMKLKEMGALYTEFPYTYTIFKLLAPVIDAQEELAGEDWSDNKVAA